MYLQEFRSQIRTVPIDSKIVLKFDEGIDFKV